MHFEDMCRNVAPEEHAENVVENHSLNQVPAEAAMHVGGSMEPASEHAWWPRPRGAGP